MTITARVGDAKRGIEPPAVGNTRGHQIKEAEAVAVERGALLCRQRRKRILANEGITVITRDRFGCSLRSNIRRNC